MSKLSTEKDLMIRFQQGEAMAFNTIYNRFFTSLRQFTHRLTCHRDQAEQIAVDTFAKLYRLYGNFDNIANIKAFLYVTARNAAYDFLARLNRRIRDNSALAMPDEWPSLYLADVKDDAASSRNAVVAAVDTLPDNHSRVFRLAYQHGLKTAEIARDLQLTETAVRGYRRGSLKLLRIALFEKRLPEAALNCLQLARQPIRSRHNMVKVD